MPALLHQFIDRDTGELRTERLYQDRLVRWMYGGLRERAPAVFRALTGQRMSKLAAALNYDLPLGAKLAGNRRFLRDLEIDLDECLDRPEQLVTARKIFERRIRYWQCRPMPARHDMIVSPADARVLCGSFQQASQIFVKEKFFRFEELFGRDRQHWHDAFRDGDFAIFRLTPEKYHYNHVPVAGQVMDIYTVDGHYHSCNPGAVVAVATPYCRNKRVVTIIDTDVAGGTGVGLVAMVEIVALMIGEVVQCYSEVRYDAPRPIERGMFLQRGQPKSLYRPGSSTDVVIFQAGRVQFASDLVANMYRPAQSRFSAGFGRPLVETDVRVRSPIATPANINQQGVQGCPTHCLLSH